MGFLDTFKGNQYKSEVERLQAELNQLRSTFTPEMYNAQNLLMLTQKLQNDINNLNAVIGQKNNEINNLNNKIIGLNNTINNKQSQIICMDEQIELQSFGLYTPKYDFASSELYKNRLSQIRDTQKALIKNGQAVTGNTNWTVNGSKSQGKKNG